MRHSQSLLAEMRALEDKRAGVGLTPAEEGRLAELRALGGPPAASRGFDINAAAAVVREEIVSATPPPVDVGALGPRTPAVEGAVRPGALGLPEVPPPSDPEAGAGAPFSGPPPEADLFPPEGFEVAGPGTEAPAGPLQAQGYDEIPAFDAGRAFALDAGAAGDPNQTARWDPAALAAQGVDPSAEPGDPQAAWDPNAQPYDPNAPQAYDPSLYPQDPNAAWDPNAQPYDPNAPQAYDPSLYPQDPNAAWDPNAQPYDPNAPQAYDPSLYPQDPNAAWDPNTQPYDPNAPQAYDPSLYPQDPTAAWDPTQPYDPNALPYDPGAPQAYEAGLSAEPLAAEPAPDTTAEWGLPGAAAPTASAAPAEATAVPEADTASWDLGRAPPAPPEESGSSALGPAEDFRHEPPAGWAGEVGEELFDQLEPVSSGSFPPIDLSVLPDAQVELPPLPPVPEQPPAPAPQEPAPLTDVYALAEQAAATEAARAPFDFELPPMTPAEEAILEVGGDVQEVEADDLAGTEPVELVEEVTRPVPEFADPLAPERPAPTPPPAAPPRPQTALPVRLADEEPEPPAAPEPAPEPEPEPQASRRDPVTVALDASVLDGATFEPPPPDTWEPDITVEEPPVAAPQPPPPEPEPPRVPAPPPIAPPPPAIVPPPPPPEPPPAVAAPPPRAMSFSEPPVRPAAPSLPPLASIFAPPGEPVSLDAIGIEETPPEPAPAPAPPAAQPPPEPPAARPAGARVLEGAFRVVLHTVEGQVKRGSLHDPVLDGGELLLEGPGSVERLSGDRIRAIFFMLDSGEKAPEPWGRRVRVTFRDGRQVAGFSPDYDPSAVGFFMIPADTRTNTARIWVYRSAVRQVSVSEPGA